MAWKGKIKKIDELHWEIPKDQKKGMRVPVRIFADVDLLKELKGDLTLEQATNVAFLQGIYKCSITLPDGHQGYGFPIGGVAATDAEEGVISPGGVGYDINCGVRLLRTNLEKSDVKPKLKNLVETLFRNVPSGVGSKSKVKLSKSQLSELLEQGAKWCVENGYGWEEDTDRLEANGCLRGADASKVSSKAMSRGMPQVGSLGSGNHFLEVQYVDEIFDPEVAKAFGITHENQVTTMIHTGSRGFGHQVCSDNLRRMEKAAKKYNIELPDRELVNVPLDSPEGQDYFSAMACAANFAWSNRQMITHWTRETFQDLFGQDAEELGMHIIYDVAHNIAKFEEHQIDGGKKKVCVHRKGATRAFPPGRPEVPQRYRDVGQPVLIPGDMGTASYVLVGTEQGMRETFGSTAHGSGRRMSRTAAKKKFWGGDVQKELAGEGIYVKATHGSVIAEEAPGAYKSVDAVAKVSHDAGIAQLVARLVPMGVAKG
ncbi:tRNA-splicing ligase [candidate division MSBL1 archaeon SCGC-AAA261G05]|uniref:tRNA-splicing ligase RtcB n=2 Tax=candidate division MSBL1 TaxID=215777 RepID=A0A133V1A1_9EURY|nr:tRNA-splicing ligase [candidate division MSBL1 archaeon SCGC-AAA261C02]KXB04194.1 tRNA-splicing ligase [candidate division MSBL1 archaeon SCGC-AAA261G05]